VPVVADRAVVGLLGEAAGVVAALEASADGRALEPDWAATAPPVPQPASAPAEAAARITARQVLMAERPTRFLPVQTFIGGPLPYALTLQTSVAGERLGWCHRCAG
jgi:hypothetical protein